MSIDALQRLFDGKVPMGFGSVVTVKTAVSLLIFSVGTIQQFRAHKYLASLPKYTFPERGWFKHLICAHYAAECLLYLGIAIEVAPPGEMLNATLATALVFIMVNLGASGKETKAWSMDKFGVERVSSKYIIIPWVF